MTLSAVISWCYLSWLPGGPPTSNHEPAHASTASFLVCLLQSPTVAFILFNSIVLPFLPSKRTSRRSKRPYRRTDVKLKREKMERYIRERRIFECQRIVKREGKKRRRKKPSLSPSEIRVHRKLTAHSCLMYGV